VAGGARLLDEVVAGVEVGRHILGVDIRQLEAQVPEARGQLHVLCVIGDLPRWMKCAASLRWTMHVVYVCVTFLRHKPLTWVIVDGDDIPHTQVL
jgi:hypothetical protein